jgi:hypothetical protein
VLNSQRAGRFHPDISLPVTNLKGFVTNCSSFDILRVVLNEIHKREVDPEVLEFRGISLRTSAVLWLVNEPKLTCRGLAFALSLFELSTMLTK